MSIHPMLVAEYQQNAQFHLQVEIIHDSMAEDADFGARGHGEFRVRGSTKRIFRGDQKLSVDDAVTFFVYVSEEVILGPASIRPRDFDTAHYMEVFLNGEPSDCWAALDCYYLIEELTSVPTVNVRTDLAREAELLREFPPIATMKDGIFTQKLREPTSEGTSANGTTSPNQIPDDWFKS